MSRRPMDGTPISGDAGKKRRTATAFARRPVAVAGEYRDETDLGLLIDLFAAYVFIPELHRWP